jgi:hypothetical protein
MESAFLLIKAADPTGSVIIVPMPSKHPMHLTDELQCQILKFLATGLLIDAKKVRDRKSIGP